MVIIASIFLNVLLFAYSTVQKMEADWQSQLAKQALEQNCQSEKELKQIQRRIEQLELQKSQLETRISNCKAGK